MAWVQHFNGLYIFFNTPQNSLYIFIAFIALAAFALVLRVLVCVGYQTQLALFQLNAKEIKSKSEIKDTKSAFVNKIVRDYIKTGDRGVAPRTARGTVDKHMNRLNFLGWQYDGMSAFAVSVERNIVFIGIILAFVFEEYRYAFAVSAVAAFVLLRLSAALFDFASARARLSLEVSEYVEREIGQFYAGDSGTLILRLKNELSAAVLKQSDALGDAIKKMGADISGVIRLSMQEMSKSVDATMVRVSDFSGELSAPLGRWKKAVDEAASAQSVFSKGLVSFEGVSQGLRESAAVLTGGLGGYSEEMKAQGALVRDEISKLAALTEGLRDASGPLRAQGEGITKQLGYIERNQEALEQSLQRFELMMEDLTRKLGDGLGSIIDFQLQKSYGALNASLRDNINQIVTANSELAVRMQELFERLYDQSRSESQAMLNIKEQMDLHFESLKG